MAAPANAVVTLPRRVVNKVQSQVPSAVGIKDQQLPKDYQYDPNWQVTDVRQITDPSATLRTLYHTDGLVSSVILSLVQTAMSGHYIMAYDTGTKQFSVAGQRAAETILASWDTVYDYTKGFSDKEDVSTLKERALLEAALTGGVSSELVLNKYKMPDRLQLFPYDTINWKTDGKGRRWPSQKKLKPEPGQSAEVDLDLPNVWVGEVMRSANVNYNLSFLISGFHRLFHYDEFIEDMRRVVRQTGGPRIVVKLDYQKVVQSAPPKVHKNPDQLSTYLESVRSDIETVLKNLQPEDALVVYDLAQVDSIETVGEKADYKNLLDAMSGLTASALKANPSILGLRLGGSQNVASTESMLFSKVAAALHGPVEKVLSRALTLAVRLLGIDVYVKFKFNPIDLRPENELEAHKSIKQNRVLELLSLGFYTDDEAASILGTGARPAGAPPLSGTMFYQGKGMSELPSPNGDPNGRQVSSQTPTSSGGRDQSKRV
jgi:hypothetical protein